MIEQQIQYNYASELKKPQSTQQGAVYHQNYDQFICGNSMPIESEENNYQQEFWEQKQNKHKQSGKNNKKSKRSENGLQRKLSQIIYNQIMKNPLGINKKKLAQLIQKRLNQEREQRQPQIKAKDIRRRISDVQSVLIGQKIMKTQNKSKHDGIFIPNYKNVQPKLIKNALKQLQADLMIKQLVLIKYKLQRQFEQKKKVAQNSHFQDIIMLSQSFLNQAFFWDPKQQKFFFIESHKLNNQFIEKTQFDPESILEKRCNYQFI